MKLYELQVRDPVSYGQWFYYTSLAEVKKEFNVHHKRLKKPWNPDGEIAEFRLVASKVTVRTDLTVEDWISLLTSDGPGLTCDLTPQDLITHREVLKEITHE